jgi:hypothetical protein
MRAMYKTSQKMEIRERQKHYSERCTDNALREIQGKALMRLVDTVLIEGGKLATSTCSL